jgi:uncharacterized protein YggE
MIARATMTVDMRLVSLLALLAYAAAAQTSDGVTLSVTRPVNIAPDQAEFSVVCTTGLDTTQQQVTQALADLGISNAVVTTVAVASNSYAYPPVDNSQLYFQVSFTTAPAAMKDVAKKLDAFRAAPPAGFTGAQFGAALTASQAAIDAAHQTALPLLLGDARTKAQALASAAGVKLGGIVGVSEWSYGPATAQYGSIAVVQGTLSTSTSSGGTQYSFSASVRFSVQ